MPSSELVAMMLADARFPSGGYAQSGGLEAAVRAGLTDVPSFAAARLRTVGAVDAGTAVVARHAVLHRTCTLSEVEDAWAARTPSRPLREVARSTGRGYLRLAGRLWPPVLEHVRADVPVPRPVVVGVVAAVAGLDAGQVARLVGYDDVATVVAASLKLVPLDPAEAAGWTLALHDDVECLVTATAGLTRPDDVPSAGAPALDGLAKQHRREELRLFHA
jgi:urease accessory protein